MKRRASHALQTKGCHCGFGLQVGIGEQHRHATVPKPLLLPQLALSPTLGDENHLRFWGTLLHKNLVVEGYDNRRYNGSQTSGSFGNDPIMWRRWRAGHVGEWRRRWSEEGSIIDKPEIGRHWS